MKMFKRTKSHKHPYLKKSLIQWKLYRHLLPCIKGAQRNQRTPWHPRAQYIWASLASMHLPRNKPVQIMLSYVAAESMQSIDLLPGTFRKTHCSVLCVSIADNHSPPTTTAGWLPLSWLTESHLASEHMWRMQFCDGNEKAALFPTPRTHSLSRPGYTVASSSLSDLLDLCRLSLIHFASNSCMILSR